MHAIKPQKLAIYNKGEALEDGSPSQGDNST
jgi:hypothetical protein